MKKSIILLVSLTILNLILISCGAVFEAEATDSYRLVNLYGYECITNDVSIWCN